MMNKQKPAEDFRKTSYVIGVIVDGKLNVTRQWDKENDAIKALRNHPKGRILRVTYEANSNLESGEHVNPLLEPLRFIEKISTSDSVKQTARAAIEAVEEGK